jgi:hypothetical protein
VNRPPRPVIAGARPATPPFFFYDKVGREMLSSYAPFFFIKKQQKNHVALMPFRYLPFGQRLSMVGKTVLGRSPF